MSINRHNLGKFDECGFDNLIRPHLRQESSFIRPPDYGSDFTAIRIDKDEAIVTSADPLALSPQLGWERSGKLAFHVVAADVAVSGIDPEYVSVNWTLPPQISDEQFENAWRGFTSAAHASDVTILGGHTARHQGIEFPMVGGATVLGVGFADSILSAEVTGGDNLVLLNHPGLEAATILSFYYPDWLAQQASREVVMSLQNKFPLLQPTDYFCRASKIPGVRWIHDLGEGGLLGGLTEMFGNRDLGYEINYENLSLLDEVATICQAADLDPLKTTSVGAGIAVVKTGQVDSFLRELPPDFHAKFIGEVTSDTRPKIKTKSGVETVNSPVVDHFWARLADLPPGS